MKIVKFFVVIVFVVVSGFIVIQVQVDEFILCWVVWDLVNVFVEFFKEFEVEFGYMMKFEFVLWLNFVDCMFNELNFGGKFCDFLIGDSQWIGGGVENGYYVKLNDFFDKEGISMDDFVLVIVYVYLIWLKGMLNYYVLFVMGDVNGWFYCKDWFVMLEIQEVFKFEYGCDLVLLKMQMELLEIVKFF